MTDPSSGDAPPDDTPDDARPPDDDPDDDPLAALAAQAGALLARLTRDEKVRLLHQHQAPVPRLGLDRFHTGTEALHGLAWAGEATVFPQALGLGTSWDPDLLRAVGAAVGDEVRACHHDDPSRCGLNVWAPVVNPLRDPRWGRNEEGYAEDPWLTAVCGTAYAEGLRGDDPVHLRTAPTLKHFLGYNNETARDTTDSSLRPRVLHEYELPAYRKALASGAAVAVMASYNLVNGRPAHVSPLLDTLRAWAGDAVVVVSDAHAPSNLVDVQRYYPDHATSHAAALRAGMDSLTDHGADSGPTVDRLQEALARGLLTEADLDRAVRRLLLLRLRLGVPDPDGTHPWRHLTADQIDVAAHRALARTAAQRATVLLTHRGLLPLDPSAGLRLTVIGPLADTLHTDWYSGTLPYAVTARAGLTARFGADAVSWCEGVDRVALRVADDGAYLTAADDGTEVHATAPARGAGGAPTAARWDVFDWGGDAYALRSATTGRYLRADDEGACAADADGPGGWVVHETFTLVEQAAGRVAVYHRATGHYLTVSADGAVQAAAATAAAATGFTVELVTGGADAAARHAAEADVAVVVLGDHPMVHGRETEDRTDLALPAAQEALLRAVHAANPRTVLVVSSGCPFALGWADAHLPAVLWSAHGGQEYGHALADVLCGDADPAGRLTQTWYRDAAELPDLDDYDIVANDATYLYFRGDPLYPFGHGHSYASFQYQDLHLSAPEVAADGEVTVRVTVANTGDRTGEEVVQLYTRQLRSRVKQPLRALRGFTRVRLAPGERTTVHLPLRAADLAHWDVTTGAMVTERARHRVMVGRSATDPRLSATLLVHGTTLADRDPAHLRAADFDDAYGVVLADGSPRRDDAVCATEADGWLGFTGVALARLRPGDRARLRTVRPAGPAATVTLRRDDPLGGAVLATFTVASSGDRYAYTEVEATLSGALAGGYGERADVYLQCDAPGTVVTDLWLERP